MKQIATLELCNFGPHLDNVINFQQLTLIRGTNDVGKSWIMYAAEVCLEGGDFPATMLTYGKKEGHIKWTFTDGTWIKRSRKGGSQSVEINDGEMTHTYGTVSDNIKQRTQDFTGFKPILIDRNDKTSVSVQIIPIDAGNTYLIGSVNPEGVLRRVNRLMSGADIEMAKSKLEGELKSLGTKAAADRKALETSDSQITILDSEDWKKVATLHQEVDAAIITLTQVDEDLSMLEQAKVVVEQYASIKTVRGLVDQAEASIKQALTFNLADYETVNKNYDLLTASKPLILGSLEELTKEDGLYFQQDELSNELTELNTLIERLAAEEAKKEAEDRTRREMEEKAKAPAVVATEAEPADNLPVVREDTTLAPVLSIKYKTAKTAQELLAYVAENAPSPGTRESALTTMQELTDCLRS